MMARCVCCQKKNMMERKEEIEESFQSIEIITDGEPKYLDELKTLDLEELNTSSVTSISLSPNFS